MQAVGGRAHRRGQEDWRRSASVCAQRRSHMGRGLEGCSRWSLLAEGRAGQDEFHTAPVALETWISTSSDGESRLVKTGLEARRSCISQEPQMRSAPSNSPDPCPLHRQKARAPCGQLKSSCCLVRGPRGALPVQAPLAGGPLPALACTTSTATSGEVLLCN